jgi:succinate dehydrogenase / fumarate reductase, membrane anchor subunit
MNLRTPLARVRGLGSAKEGVAHWWAQRITALALVPLALWLVVTIMTLMVSTYAEAVAFFHRPFNAVFMALLVGATFHHGQLGLQVVIEDYIHAEGLKVGLLLLVKAIAVVLAALGILAVLKLALTG